jgi:hypothetical protein
MTSKFDRFVALLEGNIDKVIGTAYVLCSSDEKKVFGIFSSEDFVQKAAERLVEDSKIVEVSMRGYHNYNGKVYLRLGDNAGVFRDKGDAGSGKVFTLYWNDLNEDGVE